jgi:carboxyl-terminal processing protease
MAGRAIWWCVCWLALVATAWGAAPEDKSPPKTPPDYYELYKLLIDSIDQVERNYIKEVDRRELIEAAIRGVIGKLDSYSSYISPEEIDRFRAGVESEFGGIGIQITIEDGQLQIISPLVGTPAYRAGLLAGDRIVEIDGKSTEGISLDEAVAKLKGPEGTKVTLTVIHPGRRLRETVTLVRERIHVETVLGDRRKSDDSWDFMLRPELGIGYVRITAFSRDTAAELRRALEQLQKENMRALILDLRFNPGGLLSGAIDIADMFVSSGRIVSTCGRNSPERVWNARKEGTFEGFPMVVLVNRYSASAAEIVAACLQDHNRAVIIGERTWGKGSVQNVIDLENGRSALKLTTAAYRRPSGKNIHRFEGAKESEEWGVTPEKGFEIRLGDSEIVGLLRDRQQRDVLRPKTPPAVSAGEQGSPADKADLPLTQSPTNEKQRRSSNNGESSRGASGEETRDTKGDGTRDTNGEGLRSPDNGSNGGSSGEKGPVGPQPFVDRQLEAAIKYLSMELAKAK